MTTIHRILDAIWPVCMMLAALFGFGLLFGADWPNERRLDFALLVWIAAFLVLLATIILRRMNGCDWLTIALASVFLTIAVLRFFQLGFALWPVWFMENEEWITQSLRASVAVTLTWATVLLVTTPDESEAT